jgi:type II secretory pathway component GspD/PulD (secretin)
MNANVESNKIWSVSFAALLGPMIIAFACTAWSQESNSTQCTIESTIVELVEDSEADLHLLRLLGVARNTLAIEDENAKKSVFNSQPGPTLEWIINLSQLRAIMTALEQRPTARITISPRATTLNRRRAKFADFKETFSPIYSAGSIPSTRHYSVEILPHVLAGNSISMTITPIVKTFVGYDLEQRTIWAYEGPPRNPGAHFERAPSLTSRPPKPIFREQQFVTTATVQKDETVVLSLPLPEASKAQNKIPLLADLPIAGRLVPNETKPKPQTKTLLVFVTPALVP